MSPVPFGHFSAPTRRFRPAGARILGSIDIERLTGVARPHRRGRSGASRRCGRHRAAGIGRAHRSRREGGYRAAYAPRHGSIHAREVRSRRGRHRNHQHVLHRAALSGANRPGESDEGAEPARSGAGRGGARSYSERAGGIHSPSAAPLHSMEQANVAEAGLVPRLRHGVGNRRCRVADSSHGAAAVPPPSLRGRPIWARVSTTHPSGRRVLSEEIPRRSTTTTPGRSNVRV